jgi:hypothetical protein
MNTMYIDIQFFFCEFCILTVSDLYLFIFIIFHLCGNVLDNSFNYFYLKKINISIKTLICLF